MVAHTSPWTGAAGWRRGPSATSSGSVAPRVYLGGDQISRGKKMRMVPSTAISRQCMGRSSLRALQINRRFWTDGESNEFPQWLRVAFDEILRPTIEVLQRRGVDVDSEVVVKG